MKIHERAMPVHIAENEISYAFWEGVQKHGLTYGEAIGCLARIMQTASKYMVRDERHPDDPEKGGDEE